MFSKVSRDEVRRARVYCSIGGGGGGGGGGGAPNWWESLIISQAPGLLDSLVKLVTLALSGLAPGHPALLPMANAQASLESAGTHLAAASDALSK